MGLSCTRHRAEHRQWLFLRAHLNPHLGQAAFQRGTSCLASTWGVLQVSSLECVGGRTSLSSTGSCPAASFLNGVLGHWGTVPISGSQAPRLLSPSPGFWHESGMWTVPVFHESLHFPRSLCALNPLVCCTGAHIRDRYTVMWKHSFWKLRCNCPRAKVMQALTSAICFLEVLGSSSKLNICPFTFCCHNNSTNHLLVTNLLCFSPSRF